MRLFFLFMVFFLLLVVMFCFVLVRNAGEGPETGRIAAACEKWYNGLRVDSAKVFGGYSLRSVKAWKRDGKEINDED